jgi:hypothetical protein
MQELLKDLAHFKFHRRQFERIQNVMSFLPRSRLPTIAPLALERDVLVDQANASQQRRLTRRLQLSSTSKLI